MSSGAAPPFTGVRCKIDRARKHLDELCDDIRAHLNASAVTPVLRQDDKSPWRFGKTVPVGGFPLTDWGIILGDIAHNLRSALDHLVFELAKSGTNPNRERTQFPIFSDENEYLRPRCENGGASERDRMLAGVPEEARKLIDAYQPFHPHPSAVPEHAKDRPHPLSVLSAISNRDKHRVVKVAAASLFIVPTVTVVPTKEGVTVDLRMIDKRKRDAEFFKFRTSPDPKAEVDVHVFAGKPQVWFEASGMRLDDRHIDALIDTVEDVVETCISAAVKVEAL
jgi:hypothetical protein